jgi:serine/threonine-protein kinase
MDDLSADKEVACFDLSLERPRPQAPGGRASSSAEVALFLDHRREARLMPLAPFRDAADRPSGHAESTRPESKAAEPAAPEPRAIVTEPPVVPSSNARRVDISPRLLAGLVVLAVALGVGAVAMTRRFGPASPATVTIDSPHPGAQVLVDGRLVGVTPLKMAVGTDMRSIRVIDAKGRDETVPTPATASVSPSQLEVTSDPPGVRVTVDGTARGVTPLTMPIEPGSHAVVLSQGTRTTSRTVNVSAGGTATVMASMTPAGTPAGWISFNGPLDLQVSEDGSVLGTTSASRLMLPAGPHNLELVNAALGFRTALSVDVPVGKTVTATVTVPNGSLSINALPWANVSLDGRALGTTPLANLDVPLGSHEIVWRHPQLGERRQSVLVTAKGPVRVGVDLGKQ